LLLDHLAVDELHRIGVAVERDGGIEVLDGDTDVVDPGEHAARKSTDSSTGPAGRSPAPGRAVFMLAAMRSGGSPGRRSMRGTRRHDLVDLGALQHLAFETAGRSAPGCRGGG